MFLNLLRIPASCNLKMLLNITINFIGSTLLFSIRTRRRNKTVKEKDFKTEFYALNTNE